MSQQKVREFVIKNNPEARARLTKVLEEDEQSRLESQARSRAYLEGRDDMPQWMWYLLFFVLGGLAFYTVDLWIMKWPGI